jgi:hypothetical protein
MINRIVTDIKATTVTGTTTRTGFESMRRIDQG